MLRRQKKSDSDDPDEAPSDPPVEKDFGKAGQPFTHTSFQHGLYMGLGLMVAYLIYLGLQVTLPLLIVIVVSGFLAIGLNPLVTRLQRWGMPRIAAAGTVCLGALLLVCGGIVSLVPPIITEGTAFIGDVPTYVSDLSQQQWLIDLDKKLGLVDHLNKAAAGIDTDTVMSAAGGLASVMGVAIGSLFNGIMIALLTVYFLVSLERLKNGFYRLLPARRRQRAQALGDEIIVKVGAYTAGALGIAATAGGSSFIFMLIAGVPYAYALAFVVALLDLIPQVGATLGAIMVTLVGLTVSLWVGIACAIFFVLYQQLENWVIYPTIMRRSVKVSDLGAILGILIGASLMGIVGALLAVPAVAALQLIIREVYIPRQDAIHHSP